MSWFPFFNKDPAVKILEKTGIGLKYSDKPSDLLIQSLQSFYSITYVVKSALKSAAGWFSFGKKELSTYKSQATLALSNKPEGSNNDAIPSAPPEDEIVLVSSSKNIAPTKLLNSAPARNDKLTLNQIVEKFTLKQEEDILENANLSTFFIPTKPPRPSLTKAAIEELDEVIDEEEIKQEEADYTAGRQQLELRIAEIELKNKEQEVMKISKMLSLEEVKLFSLFDKNDAGKFEPLHEEGFNTADLKINELILENADLPSFFATDGISKSIIDQDDQLVLQGEVE